MPVLSFYNLWKPQKNNSGMKLVIIEYTGLKLILNKVYLLD